MEARGSTKAIAVDAMGSDMGPTEVVAGVALALRNQWVPEKIVLVGKEEVISEAIQANKLKDHPQVELFEASEVIEMHEKPVQSLRQKKDASLVRAVELVKLGTCAAAVSCGNTGSLMACATLKLRPVQGVSKPALASVWPSLYNRFVVLDVGANPQCKPENLLHYAILGHQYAKDALGIDKPRVGLLSMEPRKAKAPI
jgi:glycerol-3-phosphate acyltransferase PlsX